MENMKILLSENLGFPLLCAERSVLRPKAISVLAAKAGLNVYVNLSSPIHKSWAFTNRVHSKFRRRDQFGTICSIIRTLTLAPSIN